MHRSTGWGDGWQMPLRTRALTPGSSGLPSGSDAPIAPSAWRGAVPYPLRVTATDKGRNPSRFF